MLTAVFQMVFIWWFSSPNYLSRELLGAKWHWVRCHTRHPINGVKALKEMQSTDPNQWPDSYPDSMAIAPFMLFL